MIVCLCHGVADRQLQALIRAGADTPRKIAAACGAGTDCGACVAEIRGMVAEAGYGAPCAVAMSDASRHSSPYVRPAPQLT